MKSVVAFGELMLSLSPKGHERLVQAGELTARYTGAESNVAVALAGFGLQAYVVSKVPEHSIGQACLNYLRRYGVDTGYVIRGGQRLGVLYLEAGVSLRPSQVIYDRLHASIREVRPGEFDWAAILAQKHWFHFSGTAPALGPRVQAVLEEALHAAKRLGLTISCDCNYRSTLWSEEEAGRALAGLLGLVDVLMCGAQDAERLFAVRPAGKDREGPARDQEAAEELRRRYGLQAVAMTLREAPSASVNRVSGLLCAADGCCRAREYEVAIVDRIGSGDAFAAGLIYGWITGLGPQQTIDFATAAACLKHTIPGDFNLVSVAEVEQLLSGQSPGQVRR